jgi:ubiquinone/menaquinone biosynthesis C-methylase UbiE
MASEKFLIPGEPLEPQPDEERTEADKHYHSSSGYLTRLPLYETTASSKEFFASRVLKNPDLRKHLTHVHYQQVEAMQEAGVEPEATVLALATGDGADALVWAEEYGHRGRIIGYNLHHIFDYGEHVARAQGYEPVDLNKLDLPMTEINTQRLISGNTSQLNNPQISLIEGDVTNLVKIPDSSIDAVTLNNFGHHASPETLKTSLLEISRVLKPDGILGFSGRGILNMYKHWSLVPHLAKFLGADEYPETFYRRCTAEQAEALLGDTFTLMHKHDYNQVEQMIIPAKDKHIFINPFFELIPNIKYPPKTPNGRVNPSRGEMLRALREIVFPGIERELKQTAHMTPDGQGFIEDAASQYFRIAKNNNYKRLR